MSTQSVAQVAVSAAVYAIDRPYSYKIPDSLRESVVPGVRVTVPFSRSNRHVEGVVLSLTDEDGTELKSVERVLDDQPVLESWQIKLALWMRDRFFCTVYDAVRAILPAGLWFHPGKPQARDKTVRWAVLDAAPEEALAAAEAVRRRAPRQADVLSLLAQIGQCSVPELTYFTGATSAIVTALAKKGFLTVQRREVLRRPEVTVQVDAEPITLNAEQQTAYDGLLPMLEDGAPHAALLYGVTGSGKTSVYIRLVEQALQSGRGAIVLVPEIALTPQLMALFNAYFPDNVAVLHSSLGIGERYDEFKRIRRGDVHVVVGTRSAVFAPVRDLGLIIMDEEHERTYKSDNAPRYHARDVAKYRCAHSGALLLLGSATPSVGSMYAAKQGKYSLFSLEKRYNDHTLPQVVIADLRPELRQGSDSAIGETLRQALEETILQGKQSILFINRRGANSFVACGACGATFECPHCSVPLTYHSANRRLMCHYCGYSRPVDERCPDCGGSLKFVGTGTQRVEQELKALFPDTEIVRMDADTVSMSGSHEKLLRHFHDDHVPILLGTQMVTKGLNFEDVTLVGVINGDAGLYANDYLSAERTFSMITQVVGRSGRGDCPGTAVIQTLSPENEVIVLAARQDYMSFYQREITIRRLTGTPPMKEMFTLTASGENEAAVLRVCAKLRDAARHYLNGTPGLALLGPAQAHVLKVNNRFRYRITVCCENTRPVRDALGHIVRLVSRDKSCRGVSVYVDVDPEDG